MAAGGVEVGEVGAVGFVEVVITFGYWRTGGGYGGAEEGREVLGGGEAGELGRKCMTGEEVMQDRVPYADL